ncbi:hypothetical protein, partial [Arthrobacter flavus]
MITGAVLGVIIGGLAGAVGYLLARRSHLDVKVIAIAVTLTVAAVWAFIVFYSGAESSSPVGVADLVIPVCTALAAGSFILLTQRTKWLGPRVEVQCLCEFRVREWTQEEIHES